MLGTARTGRKRLLPAILGAGQSVAAIAGRDVARLAEFQAEFGIPTAYPWPDAAKLLDDPGVDAIYIPLPNSTHAEWAARALEAGKHVLCEKPLALSVSEAGRVVSAAVASNRVLTENFSYHLTPAYRELAKNLAGLRSIEVHVSFPATADHRIRYDPSLGGGSFLDLGCYGVDFAHRLLDEEFQILDVRAEPPSPERREWGVVDETCVVRGRAASGVSISITSSFAQAPRQEFLLRFANGAERRLERADNIYALLESFAGASQPDPADLVRFRRNAAALEAVERVIMYQLRGS